MAGYRNAVGQRAKIKVRGKRMREGERENVCVGVDSGAEYDRCGVKMKFPVLVFFFFF